MKKLFLLTIFISLSSQIYSADSVFNYKEPSLDKYEQKKLWSTYYHIWSVKEAKDGFRLLNNSNTPISPFITAKDLCMGGIEGTIQIQIADGTYKTYNYVDHKGEKQVDCSQILGIKKKWIHAIGRTRYSLAKGAYGDGVKNYKLIPYRTIAVDPTFIPYGTVIYTPQARNKVISLPSGEAVKHDGYFFAADTGGAIKGNHIDVFTGSSSLNPFNEFVKSSEDFSFKAYIVKDQIISQELNELHKK